MYAFTTRAARFVAKTPRTASSRAVSPARAPARRVHDAKRAARARIHGAAGASLERTDDAWIVVGCDSDAHGALCVIRGPRRGVVSSVKVIDNPVSTVMINGKPRVRLDPDAMRESAAALGVPKRTRVYLEEGGVEFGFSAQTAFVQGYNFGLWRGILAAQEFDVAVVKPQAWKAALGLKFKGSTKDDSIAMAKMLFPEIVHELSRKRDHGRAESLLIAAYGHVANGAAAAEDDDALCARVRDVLVDRGLVREEGAPLPYFGPYFGMTGEELKKELKARALKVSGTKSELILRLEDDDAARMSRQAKSATA